MPLRLATFTNLSMQLLQGAYKLLCLRRIPLKLSSNDDTGCHCSKPTIAAKKMSQDDLSTNQRQTNMGQLLTSHHRWSLEKGLECPGSVKHQDQFQRAGVRGSC